MKRGFTLIELLAVIVILAIIALIAVPIIVNIINDSKNSSDEQSVELYLDAVEKTITKNQLNNPNFNPDKCRIQSNGDLDCYNDNNKLETLKVDIEGEHPEKGTIELKDNKFIYKNILLNGKYYYERGILVDDADNNNKISIGDKYTYKVNDTDTFNFYVLSFNDDNTVNLIMDRNICENGTVDYENDPNNNYCGYAWYSKRNDNRKGPITIIRVLYNATKNWINVPDMDLSGNKAYIDEGHAINSNYGYNKVETTENGIKIIDINGLEVADDDNQYDKQDERNYLDCGFRVLGIYYAHYPSRYRRLISPARHPSFHRKPESRRKPIEPPSGEHTDHKDLPQTGVAQYY